eukprot:19804-Heterococcus_DN1.PRE.2
MQKHEEHIRREYDAAASFGADRAGCRHAMRLESTAKLRAHKYLQRLKAQNVTVLTWQRHTAPHTGS